MTRPIRERSGSRPIDRIRTNMRIVSEWIAENPAHTTLVVADTYWPPAAKRVHLAGWNHHIFDEKQCKIRVIWSDPSGMKWGITDLNMLVNFRVDDVFGREGRRVMRRRLFGDRTFTKRWVIRYSDRLDDVEMQVVDAALQKIASLILLDSASSPAPT